MLPRSLFFLAATAEIAAGQLSGSVGPLASVATNSATKTCNVLDYGTKVDKTTDLGPPLTSAFAACKTSEFVVIPSGDYALATRASLSGGSKRALQLDGTKYTGLHEWSSYSSVLQGFGLYHYDIALTDEPSFHFSMDTCTNGEVYNMAIRGGDAGGLDGIDLWSENIWIHDVHDIKVTNKDECVTVKSSAHNILIENIYCNRSGGCAFGSVDAGTKISQIHHRNIYTWASNQMLMIKSNGGSGTVSDLTLEAFHGHGNAYSLNVDQYWASMSAASGEGVQLSKINITAWRGTAANGMQRGPIKVLCAHGAPCTDVSISDFAMLTETGMEATHVCRSAHGEGACQEYGEGESYAVETTTLIAAPTGYEVSSMAANLASYFGTTVRTPVPTIPVGFFPGLQPISGLAGGVESSAVEEVVPSTKATGMSASVISKVTTSPLPATTSSSSLLVVVPTPSSSTLRNLSPVFLVPASIAIPSDSTTPTTSPGSPLPTGEATPTSAEYHHEGHDHGKGWVHRTGHGGGHAHPYQEI